MSLRGRLALAAALAVAVTALAACAIAFVAARHELRSQVDQALERRAASFRLFPPPRLRLLPPVEEIGTYFQVIDADGTVVRTSLEGVTLPVTEGAKGVASRTRDAFFSDADVEGTHLRVLTGQLRLGLAVQVARPLTEVDRALRRLGFVLLAVALGGIALAFALGRIVSRAALRPVSRLTETVEEVTETRDLSRRIDVAGDDELARLAARFNEMLAALEASLEAQRQLVADASHELRTPLTSLRTNVEVLARADGLTADERGRLLADVVGQLEELTALVGDVVELARGAEPEAALEEVRLDLLVERAVERARARAPHVRFETVLDPALVRGVPERLDRAVANLLDNAAKWSPQDGAVEVVVRGGAVTVRDHGPGIDSSDLPFVFDRFYRARAARGLPGSGLGLAIVRQVAESHGGSVSAENAEGGGTLIRFELLPTS